MEIVYVTSMKKMPESCRECKMYGCSLPDNKTKPDMIKKAYMNKRHKDCPLKEV